MANFLNKYIISFLFIIFLIHSADLHAGGRPMALGNAYIAISNDVWAIYHNVSGLAELSDYQLSVSYTPARFGIIELSEVTFAGGVPFSWGVLGFSAHRFGFELYREYTGTVAYSSFIDQFNYGIAVNYHNVSIENYGSAGTLSFDVGFLINLLEDLRYGIAFHNINSATIGRSRVKLPQVFLTGVSYFAGSGMTLSMDYQKELKMPSSFNFGIEYCVMELISLRVGMVSEPSIFTGGLGLNYQFIKFDYAFSHHSILGLTHQATVSFRWNKTE